MQRPILIIEDDPDISESLKYNFEREGLVTVRQHRRSGLAAALNEKEPPSLMILDLMCGNERDELCRRLRREPATGARLSLCLTAKASESDRVTGTGPGRGRLYTKPSR